MKGLQISYWTASESERLVTTVLNSLLLFLGHDAPNGVNEAVNGEVNGHEHTNGINGHGVNGDSAKPSLRLSFAEYKRISNLLVLHLRHAEEGEPSAVITNYNMTSLDKHC